MYELSAKNDRLNQAAVICKGNVPVAPPVVRLVEKAAGQVPGSLVGA